MVRWIALVAALAVGFGGGWIAKDVTTDEPSATRPCVTDREEFDAYEAIEDGDEPDCVPPRKEFFD